MRLVPISNPRPTQRVICGTCAKSVSAHTALADLDARAFTFRCVLDALEDGSLVVLSLPVRVVDAERLQVESRRLYAAQGGDDIDATIEWPLSDAIHECCLSTESYKDHLGFRVGRPSASLATIALEDRQAPLAWHWAGHPGLTFQLEVRIDSIVAFREALANFGPPTVSADPSEQLGVALRSFVASLASPLDMGFEIHAYRLHVTEHPHE